MDASGPALYRLLVRLTLRQDVAEELMQELALRLLRSVGFARASDPAAYAARSAIHLAMDWRRTRSRSLVAESIKEPMATTPSPMANIERIEDLEAVMNGICGLRGTCREAFILHYVEELPYEQVAERLEKTAHQVRALCTKAMQRLRKLLNCS